MRPRVLAALLLVAFGFRERAVSAARDRFPVQALVSGGEFEYQVQRGDTFAALSSRFGVGASLLARANNLKPAAALVPGSYLTIDNRHVVPAALADGIVLNVPQRMLFLFEDGRLLRAFPIAVGKQDWRTPTGPFVVLTKEEEPTWDVPVSIQEEMRRAGREVITRMPPCPANPLGRYWLGLSLPAVGIHGTIAPASIYRFATHGCIRLHPADVADLFDLVEVGTPGRVVYEPVLVARTAEGRVLLEANPDAYERASSPSVEDLASALGPDGAIDRVAAERTLKAREGIARDVTAR